LTSVSNRFGVAKSSLLAYAVNALGYVLTVLRIRLRGYEFRSIYDFWKLAGSGKYIVEHRTFFCKIQAIVQDHPNNLMENIEGLIKPLQKYSPRGSAGEAEVKALGLLRRAYRGRLRM
jgi:hypothetical protein